MRFKKYLSILLSGAMLCTLSPLTAFAGESEKPPAANQIDEATGLPAPVAEKVYALFHDEANRHIAANPDQPLRYVLWAAYYKESWDGSGLYVSLTSCLETEGTPDETMTENIDYCNYDAESQTYYQILRPYEMILQQDWDGNLQPLRCNASDETADPDYFWPSDRYVVGDKLYVRDFNEDGSIYMTTTYVPVTVLTKTPNPLMGKDTLGVPFIGEDQEPNENDQYVGNGKFNLSGSYGTLVTLSGDGLSLRMVNDRIWKPEAGDLLIKKNPEATEEFTLSYETAKSSGEVTGDRISSEGPLTLTLTYTRDAETAKLDELSSLFGEMYQFSNCFSADEPADDGFVADMVARHFYTKASIENLWKTEYINEKRIGVAYTIPYADFIAYADEIFANHTDLKDFFLEDGSGETPGMSYQYDKDAGTVQMIKFAGGAGGWDMFGKMLNYWQDGDMIYVRGVSSMGEGGMAGWTVEEGMVEYFDYFTEQTEYGPCRYFLGGPCDVVLRLTENGYQIVSHELINFYLLDNGRNMELYERNYKQEDEYTRTYDKTTVYEPLTVEVRSTQLVPLKYAAVGENECCYETAGGMKISVTNDTGAFKTVNGKFWYEKGSKLTWKITAGEGEIIFKDSKKEGTMSEGSMTPDGALTLTLESAGAAASAAGDLDGDGNVTVSDAVLIARVLAELPDTEHPDLNYADADADGDGLLTVLDVRTVPRALKA
ncbi:MAG: dockerin type I repeat-containing protein [Oscillospiraceae bacterium]|nr:dockerin type I repeat-containing protein [Oscillospiraceae bacterium]